MPPDSVPGMCGQSVPGNWCDSLRELRAGVGWIEGESDRLLESKREGGCGLCYTAVACAEDRATAGVQLERRHRDSATGQSSLGSAL